VPTNDESAGKRRSTRLRKGAPWLKTTLVQTAWCATRAKKSYLRAQFLRLKARRGPRKAIVAVAASTLTAAYYMLARGENYRDLGPTYLQKTDRQKAARRLLRKLSDLGFQADLRDAA
jgi:transposase